MIASLTESMQKMAGPEHAIERGKAFIAGKRNLMKVLVEKTVEYYKHCDPNSEVVVQEISAQYEAIIDASLKLTQEAPNANSNRNSVLGRMSSPSP